jgi:hypothetical protein
VRTRRICHKDRAAVEVALMRLLRDEHRGIVRCAVVVVGSGHEVGLGGARLAAWASDAEMVEDCALLAAGGAEVRSRFFHSSGGTKDESDRHREAVLP